MAQILVRNLDHETVARLKRRAEQAGRSLEAEVREILEYEAGQELRRQEGMRRLQEIRDGFGDRVFSDSVELRHEGRR